VQQRHGQRGERGAVGGGVDVDVAEAPHRHLTRGGAQRVLPGSVVQAVRQRQHGQARGRVHEVQHQRHQRVAQCGELPNTDAAAQGE